MHALNIGARIGVLYEKIGGNMGKDTRKWTTSPNGRVMAGWGALATSSTHDVLLRNGRTWQASSALKEAVLMLQRWRSSRDTAHGGRSAASEDQMSARHSCNPQTIYLNNWLYKIVERVL